MKMNFRGIVAIVAGMATAMGIFLAGCQTTPESTVAPLRVGITPDYPPLVFRQQNKPAGIEIELARALGQALQRPVQFIEVPWDEQITALLNGKTDIIMSGMTITDARKVRINFSEPWLKLGLMALVRSPDKEKYPTAETLTDGSAEIGVQKDSTAAAFVMRQHKGAGAITYLNPRDVPSYLNTRKIDVFIHDGPAIIWMASENEAELEALPHVLTEDMIAWGMRKGDDDLKQEINTLIEQWRQDGTLKQIITKWLPAELL